MKIRTKLWLANSAPMVAGYFACMAYVAVTQQGIAQRSLEAKAKSLGATLVRELEAGLDRADAT
ncbi:MAG: hypothetical protein JNK82_41785, partial [Myxococcaceae bacterium]|nr:hypothetical protein [Myxococcaceae bacterium]